MTTLIFITTMSYWVTHAERFKTHQFFPLRVIAFICNALYGLVPMVQILAYEVWLRTYNVSVENILIFIDLRAMQGLQNEHLRWGLLFVLLMLLSYGLGVLVYTTQFPECKWPGRFDLVVRVFFYSFSYIIQGLHHLAFC